MHAIRGGLDAAIYNLDQVLEYQGRQVDLVTDLDMVHKLVVDLAYCRIFDHMGKEKIDMNKCSNLSCTGGLEHCRWG